MVRKYKKRTYKPRKRTYKRRIYRRRYYKRRYKPIKKPEIHIVESNYNNVSFNNTTNGMGIINNLTSISSNSDADIDNLVFSLNGKDIEGKKVRLKYLYIKGYIKVSGHSADYSSSQTQTGGTTGHIDDGVDDNFNCKLMIFRWKRNTVNSSLLWGNLVNNIDGIDLTDPSTWTDDDRLSLMYKQDWKNDIKVNFYKKVKNLYRKYDNINNVIPFKIRVPLYDCVLSCDSYKNATDGKFYAHSQPSTNGLYFTFLSNKYDVSTVMNWKYKLYYTDY